MSPEIIPIECIPVIIGINLSPSALIKVVSRGEKYIISSSCIPAGRIKAIIAKYIMRRRRHGGGGRSLARNGDEQRMFASRASEAVAWPARGYRGGAPYSAKTPLGKPWREGEKARIKQTLKRKVIVVPAPYRGIVLLVRIGMWPPS